METVSFGLSPCPNDTFIFDGLLHGRVPKPCPLRPFMADVEALNRGVLSGTLDVSKVSYGVLGHVLQDYVVLRAGSALGRGCGPLVVGTRPASREDLAAARLAVPGEHTTAALLLRLFAPKVRRLVPMHFAEIVDAVTAGEVDAGVIIHETRFTYATRGLTCIRDLGAWWEEETGLPIPLGGIVARRTLGSDLITAVDEALRASVLYAREHPEDSRDFVRAHARELSEEVTGKHIGLYVNEFTVDLGEEGQQAILRLLQLGQDNGVFPKARPGSHAAASIFR